MHTRKLRVVQIVRHSSVAEYPECAADTIEFPHLVPYVEDDMEIFIVDAENPSTFWPARDFFFMTGITSLLVNLEELS